MHQPLWLSWLTSLSSYYTPVWSKLAQKNKKSIQTDEHTLGPKGSVVYV